jgi:hypothetical protein
VGHDPVAVDLEAEVVTHVGGVDLLEESGARLVDGGCCDRVGLGAGQGLHGRKHDS